MSAIFVSLKPCLIDIERWLPAKMSQLNSSLWNKLFEIRAQVLFKQNIFLDIWITYFSLNINNFSTDMSAIFVWLKPCLTGIERWLPAETWKVQNCIRSLSKSERKFESLQALSNIFFVKQVQLRKYDTLLGAYHHSQHWKLLVNTNLLST